MCVFLFVEYNGYLQASEFFELQSHWFLSLHDFKKLFLYTSLVDYRSLMLERPVLGAQFPHKCL